MEPTLWGFIIIIHVNLCFVSFGSHYPLELKLKCQFWWNSLNIMNKGLLLLW